MTMKNFLSVAIFLLSLIACNNKDNDKAPDVANIKVDLKMDRFDKDFLAIGG